jgi:acetyltransferase-like isoleucine patch superfamily enzyme
VEIGVGTYIGPLAVVSVSVKIGKYVLIETHVSIGHDAVLGDFCEVFPGAAITGGCCLGEYSVVGSNATLLPGTVVGNGAVVGAGSLARGSVQPDTTVLGVPAAIIHKRANSAGGQ